VSEPNRALLLGSLSVIPLLVWWLGWFPGFLSTDSIDQLGQAARFDFFNFHPISHTFSLWAVTRVWDHPGAVTLVQVLVLAGMLGYIAKRLTQAGVPWWIPSVGAWIVATLPMVAATTITIWKDVPYTLAMLWAFAEVLVLARDRDGFWTGRTGPMRLGIALGLMWALRPNGALTVLLFLLALAIGFRGRLRSLLPTAVAAVLVGVAVPSLLLTVLPAQSTAIEPAEVFMADIGSVVVHNPEWFSEADRSLLEAVGPIAVWNEYYACADSTPLLFHPAFDTGVARDDPWAYRALVVRTSISNLPTVVGHRACAASYLVWPVQPDDSFLHRPPFEIPPNTLGIARSSISDRAYALTLAQYQWIEQDGVIWFTWRPALMILAGLATYVAIALRKPLRPLLWGGALAAAQLINVAATTPAQEFRYAFGLYLIAAMSLPMWWLVVRPEDAELADSAHG
jgi:hypothetical protein